MASIGAGRLGGYAANTAYSFFLKLFFCSKFFEVIISTANSYYRTIRITGPANHFYSLESLDRAVKYLFDRSG